MKEKEKNIEKTLGLLEEKISPEYDYYYQTRLNAKLKKELQEKESRFGQILKPALIFALVLLNILTLLYGLSSSDNNITYDRQDLIEVISDEVFYSAENSTY
ncbi:MAG: hypothetical protein JW917_07430 [Ignavibacteria bacterium]|nr:hypothetical protein [Ignavibacteria bacterium]